MEQFGWPYFLEQGINGLVLGNIYALLAIGISLIFGVCRLVNFAHGSLVMAGAYIGWFLTVRLALPWELAIVLAILAVSLLAILVERIAIRPFAAANHRTTMLTTLAIALVLDQSAQLVWGPETQAFTSTIASSRIRLGQSSIGWTDILIATVVLATILILAGLLKSNRWGRALRAMAQDSEAAAQMGIPIAGLQTMAFAISGTLAAIAGLLFGLYYQNLSPTMGFQLGLKGFSAAILGGIASLPAAALGGLALGLAETLGISLFGSVSRNLFAFGILLIMLLIRPNGLFASPKISTPEVMTGTFHAAGTEIRIPGWGFGALFLFVVLLPLVLPNSYFLQIGTNAWILGLLALSVTITSGFCGISVLGQAGFAAIGAYSSALLTTSAKWSFVPAFLMAGLIPALIAGFGFRPLLRLTGHQIALATLALGEVVTQIILLASPLTGGALGVSNIPLPVIWGREILSAQDWYYLSAFLVISMLLVWYALRRAPLGRTFLAIRDDPLAATSLGVAIGSYRALAFAIGALVAGLSGSLAAHNFSYINHETFGSQLSILALTTAIAGGSANPLGAVVGAVGLTVLGEALRGISQLRWIAYGAVLLLTLRFRPQGWLGSR